MRALAYSSWLTRRQKMVYFSGRLLERCIPARYEPLLARHRLFSVIEKQGFTLEHRGSSLVLAGPAMTLRLRQPGSDLDTFEYVFAHGEYDLLLSILRANEIDVRTIVDAGANIGLTTLLLKRHFPAARVVCLEPDPANFALLTENVRRNLPPDDVALLDRALWPDERALYLDRTYGDRREWAVRTVEHAGAGPTAEKVRSTTVDAILRQMAWPRIDVLKVDIEGSEHALFAGNTDFLDCVKIVAVEIHRDLGDPRVVHAALRRHGFLIVESGDTTIGINKNK